MTFTPCARAGLSQAGELSQRFGHDYVGSEHLLLGLLQEPKSGAARVLLSKGITGKEVQSQLLSAVGVGAPLPAPRPLTPRLRKIVEAAVSEALRLQSGTVGSRHLLLGLLRQGDGGGVRLLSEAGVHPNQLYRQTAVSLGGGGSPRSKGDSDLYAPAPSYGASSRLLEQHCVDMVQRAARGGYDPVAGREEDLRRLVQILLRRSKNNPVLLGEPGVGKTAVVEALAQRIASGQVPDELRHKRLLSLDLPSMIAGTKYRGEFEERVKNIVTEIRKAGNILLFLDELHTILGAGGAEGAIDAANILKPALSRGDIQLIGATTLEEYRHLTERDSALERRFQPVRVTEPTEAVTLEILKTLSPRYCHHHGLTFAPEALSAAVSLSVRYLPDRRLPDKAIDLLDEAASQVRLRALEPSEDYRSLEKKLQETVLERDNAIDGQDYEKAALCRDAEADFRRQMAVELNRLQREKHTLTVSPKSVAAVVSQWTGIPLTALTQPERERLLGLEGQLRRRVSGQEEAVSAVARAVRRGRAGLKEANRPIGCFLFLGPTGVGKTELCKALAEALFGREEALLRFDMTEFSQPHTASRLTGSPPGYVGHEDGGQLTEAVRRHPYSVVLFDELEKAHPDVWSLLLQIMEDGILTDTHGRTANFRSTVVVMTSNAGGERLSAGTPLGFAGAQGERGTALLQGELRQLFRPEFLNRLDETVVFRPLNAEAMTAVAEKLLGETADRLAALGVTLLPSPAAVRLLAERGQDSRYGARPLRRLIRSEVENPASDLLLREVIGAGDTLRLNAEQGVLTLSPVPSRP